MAFLKPKAWSEGELRSASKRACAAFAAGRKTEGIDYYLGAYESSVVLVDALLEATDNLLSLKDEAARLFSDGRLREVRYLASPPISEDDLKSLAELESTSKTELSDECSAVQAIEIIEMNLDPVRFPWVYARRRPTSEERSTALISTAALMASQKTQTRRRTPAREIQENTVAAYLGELGFAEVARRSIALASDAPRSGEFCRECKVGGKKADIVIGMDDGRFMALECKVSNSEVNSFKRLNHETVEKVQHWNSAFGTNGVVGAAVLAGVFKVANLLAAQEEGVSIFWSFDLAPLGEFLKTVAGE